MERKKIGIGCEDYKRFIEEQMYYADKTLLIRDLIQKGGAVTLFTRPRRFGKTVALSMLQTFFEKETGKDGKPADKRRYFEGKKICSCGEEILSRMGQFPVIRLSLKSAKSPDFYTAFLKLREQITGEFRRHAYLKDSAVLDEEQRKNFCRFMEGISRWKEKEQGFCSDAERERALKWEVGRYSTSLWTLSQYLAAHHGSRVIVLLDEYDAPLENAYHKGFYGQMEELIRSLFESVLKTNDALEFGVIMGCLRISRESVFGGLNHLKVNSVRGADFGAYFGFTREETQDMLAAYDLSAHAKTVQSWYGGYLFAGTRVYDPWGAAIYAEEHKDSPERLPESCRANPLGNSMIRTLVEEADEGVREELDRLIRGGTIEKPVHEDITYEELYESKDNLWNFLFLTGCLGKVSEKCDGERILLTMRIPNRAVESIYREQITNWFERILRNTDRQELYKAIVQKDVKTIEKFLKLLLEKAVSTFDCAEHFYHAFLLSLLTGFPGYTVKSGRETGAGRSDIVLCANRHTDPACLFVLKVRKKYHEMEGGLLEAYSQILEKRYEEGLLEEGCKTVISIAVCFCQKDCIAALFDRERFFAS